MKEIFHELYEKYHHDVFQFLFYMVKSKEQAEDLVQEVYIKVLKSYKNFQGNSSEKTWLYSIARHVAIDWFRKQKREKQKTIDNIDFDKQEYLMKDESPLPDEIALQNEEIQDLYRCLDYCTVDQRLVIIFRYIQGFSIAETAEVLDWTESKVKTTQHRGIKALKALMENVSKEETADEKINI